MLNIGYIFQSGINEVIYYLSAHVVFCLIPAFFIAGGISAVLSQNAVLKYFGPKAPRALSYGVASISGCMLAVCSCTVLPIFAGIYKKGAGIGPAIAFLFSGPAINVLAISLTASEMGWELGFARALSAIFLAIAIGLIMEVVFKGKMGNELEHETGSNLVDIGKTSDSSCSCSCSCSTIDFQEDEKNKRPILQTVAFFGVLFAILIFGTMSIDLISKTVIIGILTVLLLLILHKWYSNDEIKKWLSETWRFVKLIFPVLLIGVFLAGVIKAVMPSNIVTEYVGQNYLSANFIASLLGALMYFSTLTEVPIVSAFLKLGMHEGPALALLLAGPSLSLPNMLVIRNIIGTKKVIVYVLLVVLLATIFGMLFGYIIR